jgi:hypothetical protein
MDRYSDRYNTKTKLSVTVWDKEWAKGNEDLRVKTGAITKAGRASISTVRTAVWSVCLPPPVRLAALHPKSKIFSYNAFRW